MLGKFISKVGYLRSLEHIKTIRNAFSSTSQQKPIPQGEELDADRMHTFYRNSIRRINVNDKGRGKFTEHHLIKLTKLTENERQLPLLFQGYYNFVGHFTVITNKTVDKMLIKAMSFPQTPVQQILQIYSNHNYLAYFPGYHITQQLLKITSQNQQQLSKLINILYVSPFIKINQPIISTLLSLLHSETLSKANFSIITKLLTQRSVLNIIESIKPTDLIGRLAQSIKKRFETQNNPIMNDNSYVIEFLQKIKERQQCSQQTHQQIAIVALSFGIKGLFSDSLFKLTSNTKVQNFGTLLQNCSQSYQNSVLTHLESHSPSKDLLLKLFKPLNRGSQIEPEEGKQE